MLNMPYEALLFYSFHPLDDPQELARDQLALCEQLELRGRIIVASEGINGVLSGEVAQCAWYRAVLRRRFPKIEFKIDQVDGHVFKRLSVKVRTEIITMGVDHPPVHDQTGQHLSPQEWREVINEPDVVLLDGRNKYESELGHFEGALLPDVETFREFPAWIKAHRAEFEGKRILTYCTGGIRCEKLTSWLLQEGFSQVFQLDGGIVRYGKETDGEGFIGMNVVFDDRVLVAPSVKSKPITHCRECGVPSANYVNCASVTCNLRMILCADCESKTERCCSESCRAAPRRRDKNAKLRPI